MCDRQSRRLRRRVQTAAILWTLGLSLACNTIFAATAVADSLSTGLPNGLLVKDEKNPKAKVFRPPPPTSCPKCVDFYNQLKAALESYYIQQYNVAQTEQNESGVTTANSGAKGKAGAALQQLGSIAKDDKNNYDNDQLQQATARDKQRQQQKDFPKDTNALTQLITKLMKDLTDCETGCKGAVKPPDKPQTPPIKEVIKKDEEKKTDEKKGGVCADALSLYGKLPEIPETPSEFQQYLDWCKGVKLPTCGDKDQVKTDTDKLLDDVKQALERLNTISVKGGAAEKQTQPAAEACTATKKEIQKYQTDTLPNLKPCKEGEKDCPEPKEKNGQGGYYVPPQRTPGTFYVSQNSSIVCTYDNATPVEVAYTPLDLGGQLIATSTPAAPADFGPQASTPTPNTPAGADRPPAASTPDSPKIGTPATPPPPTTTTDTPPAAKIDTPSPQTTDTPPPKTTTSDTPPPTTTVDVQPPQGPDDVETYDKDTVEKDGHTESGGALQGQLIMLAYAKPELPGTGDKAALDTGFNRDPAKCTTGADGHCQIHIQPDERALYGLAATGTQPAHYRLDLNDMKHSGGIAETTGKTVKPELASILPPGAQVATSTFKIGNRTFMRLGFATPSNHGEDRLPAYSEKLGAKVETDSCDDDKPAADLETSAVADDPDGNGLPSATIRFPRLIEARSNRR
jgi:hypothetical protein